MYFSRCKQFTNHYHMKRLNVKFLPELEEMRIDEIGSYLTATTLWHPIKSVNWPEQFDYKPIVKFMIARSEEAFYIQFKSEETNIKAVYTNDQDPVWQDSCVEFFVQLPNEEGYANFEFNCIGTCLATRRTSRTENIRPLSANEMQTITRFTTLGTEAIELDDKTTWELTVRIPYSILGISHTEKPYQLRANFFKCGDETATPHYLSWNEIDTPSPDFHRPEFFGILTI